MTEAAINTTLTRDLYVSLSFVACIWIGGFIMALGGLISITDRRYRRPVKRMNKQQMAEIA